jgi:hypothetical protein
MNDPSKKSIIVEIPKTASEQSVMMTQEVLVKLSANGKILAIQGEYASFELPQGFFAADIFKGMDKSSQLKLRMEAISMSDAGVKYGVSISGKDQSLIFTGSGIFEFGAEIVTGSEIEELKQFAAPIRVSVKLGQADLKDAGNGMLDIYCFNPVSVKWEPMGGVYDPATGSISFSTQHFSLYAVMKLNGSFTDISKHWAKTYIERMVVRKIAKGKTANEFKPEDTITRAEFTALLVRALELKDSKNAGLPFEDIGQGKWYRTEMETAYGSKILLESDGVNFRPEIEITREDMAVLLARALKLKGLESGMAEPQIREVLARFKDENSITAGARASMAFIVDNKLMNGRTSDILEPRSNMTRAEAITMICRMLDLLKI